MYIPSCSDTAAFVLYACGKRWSAPALFATEFSEMLKQSLVDC